MLLQGGIPTLPTSVTIKSSWSAPPLCLSIGISLLVPDSRQTGTQKERLNTAHTRAHRKMWALQQQNAVVSWADALLAPTAHLAGIC